MTLELGIAIAGAAAAATAYLHATFATRRELRRVAAELHAIGARLTRLEGLLMRVALAVRARLGPEALAASEPPEAG